MRAVARIVQMLAASNRHEAYAASLQPGSVVAVAKLNIHVEQDRKVVSVGADGISVNDGRLYTDRGHCDEQHTGCRFIVEPIELSREQEVQKNLVRELKEFPWKALMAEQLDAALKFARAKYQISPKAKTKAALEKAA